MMPLYDSNPICTRVIKNKNVWHLLKLLVEVGFILGIMGLYWYGAEVQNKSVNTDMTRTDQSAYMNYARSMYESNYSFIGDRNRMPLYPFLQSLILNPNMSDETFFELGKKINLVLSLGLLIGLIIIIRKHFSSLHSLNLLLIVAFTVFIFKAGYFQAELLFYFLNFCLFLLMWKFFHNISWQLAVMIGVFAGLAHLTKASILPGLVIFLVLASTKLGWCAFQRRNASRDKIPIRFILWQLLSILLVLVAFLVTVFPYIKTSKQVFDHYFYNVNSTFYIWYDSWEEAKRGTRAHGDRIGWPDMPPEEIPSLSKYLREHTLNQIISRFIDGGRVVLNNVVKSYGYFKYIVIYLLLLLIAILLNYQRVRQALMSNPIYYLFLIIYFAIYFLLYFWYAPIASGNRLILAQFIPLIFTISYGFYKLVQGAQLKINGSDVNILMIINWALLLIIIVDIFFIMKERVGTLYGGS